MDESGEFHLIRDKAGTAGIISLQTVIDAFCGGTTDGFYLHVGLNGRQVQLPVCQPLPDGSTSDMFIELPYDILEADCEIIGGER